MGKNQHSKDMLHLRPTEWAQDGRGFKAAKWTPFSKLPLNCCFLSLQPFDRPVGTRDGSVFEIAHILKYIKKYGQHPVHGGKLEVKDLVPLHFHRNAQGDLHCPVTFKVLGNNTAVCANLSSGHVYCMEAVLELNKKNKNWKDLMTSQPFKWTDIVLLQDPDQLDGREVSKFHFMVMGQQDEVVREITNPESKVNDNKEDKLRPNAAVERIFAEKERLAEKKVQEAAEKAAADPEAAAAEEAKAKAAAEAKQKLQEAQERRKFNERYTSNEVGASFTSTAVPVKSNNQLRKLTEEEELQDIYDQVRKKKQKGYVRMVTTVGCLNLEIHCNIAPRTSDNFLRLCEKSYYNNTIFHRLIHNFMLQGGDPTGTGRGGESAFEGGKQFKDEFDSRLVHQGPGVVSMANNGKNTNRSQFFVSLKSCEHLNNKHSVFGKVVGGLNLLEVLNKWEVDAKDKPVKEIKLLRTEVFKNPFQEVIDEMNTPKVEKVVDPAATWFSNRRDPMQDHKNRNSSQVGKYLDDLPALPGEKRKSEDMPNEEVEYANVTQKSKRIRTDFDFSSW
ncbi:unnamed protein product [Effrenium voratum]|uniref:RING-type E3 ubiquitin transferase n=1 Tax=Effrenium voratum TaxID=2562239 RepID=A0AA36NL49_9DINO|nr:unnamed protein product [Effrenium voratum]CAJ1460320.1 unnamed protein product [Effrenium voratum]|eukprot:CAMPEP_0181412256 /NCGR_PEP_ID=MMETSP1110-20121109/8325_1 /TAXON_ID=174948 /ORGANISM="Symbiodinium sp., Strain CCMP421" /LENGTH=557 /DNA_ID=CAMNT_0023534957 /DNA_START=52 /DNA_END=1725 /DNA_ORIENTATION=-